MKRLEETKRELKGLLTRDPYGLFRQLKHTVSPSSPLLNDILIQEKRSRENERQFAQGMISAEQQHVAYNQVSRALLFIIDEMKEEDLAVAARQVFDLKVPHLKPDLLRCNRREAKSWFEEQFHRLSGEACQHYVLLANRHQQPRSFVERLVFELEERGLSLHYEAAGENHIRTAALDPGISLEGAKLFYKEYMSKRFGQNLESIDGLASAFPPSSRYDYVVTAFEFNTSWKAHTGQLLHWAMTDFCRPEQPLPTHFLFFYLIDEQLLRASFCSTLLGMLNGQPGSRKLVKSCLEQLRAIPNCTIMPRLKPVSVEELANWFHEFVSNAEEVDRLVAEVLQPLGQKQNGMQLDMSFIEKRLMNYLS